MISPNLGYTFRPKSNIVPCSLACANTPNNGMTTAEIPKPAATINHWSTALAPNSGGSMKLPPPKNIENIAKAVIHIFFVKFEVESCIVYIVCRQRYIFFRFQDYLVLCRLYFSSRLDMNSDACNHIQINHINSLCSVIFVGGFGRYRRSCR